MSFEINHFLSLSFHIRRMDWIIMCLILWQRIGDIEPTTCSSAIKQGPYVFEKPIFSIFTPSKHNLYFTRLTVIEDVEIAIMYRSYWSSYCYMGGNIDPNTGLYLCNNRYTTNDFPTYKEADEWIDQKRCLIGNDCTDCWGSDAQACVTPPNNKSIWVNSKEMKKLENNHFFFHTCNLSWRCGIHIAKFPTFITRRHNNWVAYTEYANGTEFDLSEGNFWILDDILLKPVKPHRTVYTTVEVQCFLNENNETACFDPSNGIFFELIDDHYCFQRNCYMFNTVRLT